MIYLNRLRKALRVYRATYRNWLSVLLNLVLRGRARAAIRGGNVVEGDEVLLGYIARLHTHWLHCCRLIDVSNDLSYAVFEIGGRRVTLYGWRHIPFKDLDSYSGLLDVKGKSVLDVGAYVGDSAILFALMGARKVVAVEPSPWAYSVAKRNVEANGLGSVITLVNCAVSREDGKTLVLPSREIDPGFSALAAAEGDVPVPTCTLDSLIEKYGPFDVVKVDCEGCEHESIPYSRRVGEVKEILVEYHGGYEDVERKLRDEGFKNINILKLPIFCARVQTSYLVIRLIHCRAIFMRQSKLSCQASDDNKLIINNKIYKSKS